MSSGLGNCIEQGPFLKYSLEQHSGVELLPVGIIAMSVGLMHLLCGKSYLNSRKSHGFGYGFML